MDGISAIKNELAMGMLVLKTYLEDITTEELKIRPAKKANSLAWQIGHLICSEYRVLTSLGASVPQISDDFIKEHSFDNTPETKNNISKEEYLSLYEKVREATLNFLSSLTNEDLDKPGPEYMKDYAPTIGSVLLLQGSHMLMHAGQIAVFRREHDKKIVI